jgi:hypothetical protein
MDHVSGSTVGIQVLLRELQGLNVMLVDISIEKREILVIVSARVSELRCIWHTKSSIESEPLIKTIASLCHWRLQLEDGLWRMITR